MEMVVGLGVGTIAAYGNTSVDADLDEEDYVTVRETGEPDYMGFYELNPQVTRWATGLSTYIADAEARGTEVGLFEGVPASCSSVNSSGARASVSMYSPSMPSAAMRFRSTC